MDTGKDSGVEEPVRSLPIAHSRLPIFVGVISVICGLPDTAGYDGEIQHTVDMVILSDLMALAAGERASNQVRAIASWKLEQLKMWLTLQSRLPKNENERAFLFYLSRTDQTLSRTIQRR